MSTKDIVIVIDSLQNRIQKYPQLGNKKDKFYNLLETIKNDYKKQEVPDNLLEVYNSLVKKGKELNNKFSATANAKEINVEKISINTARSALCLVVIISDVSSFCLINVRRNKEIAKIKIDKL